MISPYIWDIFLILIGVAVVDLVVVRIEAKRMYRAIKAELMHEPTAKSLLKLMRDPNFEYFMLNTIDTVGKINEMVRKIEKEGISWLMK